jgi:hypothetical protein
VGGGGDVGEQGVLVRGEVKKIKSEGRRWGCEMNGSCAVRSSHVD